MLCDLDQQRPNPTLLRLLEGAREQRGSPPLWDAVAARLDDETRRRDVVAPMLRLLDQIHERVDDETWQLILDFEWRSSREVVTGVEVGLKLGYDHGRAAALLEAQRVLGCSTAHGLRGLRVALRRRGFLPHVVPARAHALVVIGVEREHALEHPLRRGQLPEMPQAQTVAV